MDIDAKLTLAAPYSPADGINEHGLAIGIITDTNGNSVVIEFVNGRMVETKKNDNFQVATNFTLYDNTSREGFGKDRYESIENELKKRKKIISENEALELLKKNVIPGDEQWSCVYNLAKRSVAVTFARDYNHVYQYKL